MKKFLLFVMLLSFVSVGFSQNQKQEKLLKKSKDINTELRNNLPLPQINQKSVNEDVNRIEIGTAADFRTVRREDTRAISYNPELDVITVTMILDPDTYGTNGTDIGMFFSTDHGQTWDGPLVIVDNGDSYVNDYPSGIVFNPEENEDLMNSYGIIQSISHVGGDWGYKMWSSMQMNGDNQAIEVVHNPDNVEDGYWNQIGLTQVMNQVRCMSMVPQGDWGNYTSAELQPIYGDFSGTDFDWDYSDLVEMDLYQNSDDGTMAWIGGYRGFDGGLDMAWSDDGQIGYIYLVGSNNENATGYQPLIYRTDDGGNSWDFIELDFLTDEMQAFFEPYIIEATGGLMIPRFFESCSAVDYHGDLQLFAAVGAHSADVTEYRDSLGYAWTEPGDLFNLTIDDSGLKDILWIDSLNTVNLDDDDEGSYAGNGWNHRLFVAKNVFRNEFFLSWTDTRDVVTYDINAQPDIFTWSRNVHTGDVSDVTCITEGTLYETFYFFTYGAENAIYDVGTNTYTVPYITAVSPGEFASNGASDPITFNYVTGVEFPALGDYVATNELDKVVNFQVSQNQPNPFTGATTIEVKTQNTEEVLVEVSNIMGQTIYTMDAGSINGTQKITLTSDNMEAGIYFYTVTVGEESVIKKMIVE